MWDSKQDSLTIIVPTWKSLLQSYNNSPLWYNKVTNYRHQKSLISLKSILMKLYVLHWINPFNL